MVGTLINAVSLALLLGVLSLVSVLIAQRWGQIVGALRDGTVIADRAAIPPLHFAVLSARSS